MQPMTEPTTTGPATTTITRTDEDRETEDGPMAHIVKTKPGEDAAAKVLGPRGRGHAARGAVRSCLGAVP